MAVLRAKTLLGFSFDLFNGNPVIPILGSCHFNPVPWLEPNGLAYLVGDGYVSRTPYFSFDS